MKVKRSSRRFIKPSCSPCISWEDFFRRPKRVEGSGVPLQLGPHLPQALSCALAMDSWDSFYFGKRWVQTCRGWFYWFGVWDVCSNCIFSSGNIMVLNLELTAKSVWHFEPHVLSQFFPKKMFAPASLEASESHYSKGGWNGYNMKFSQVRWCLEFGR